jgi:hypothetical protein
MNRRSILAANALLVALVAPAVAETYGEAAPDAAATAPRIKTVSPSVPFNGAVTDKTGERWRLSAGRPIRQDLIAWGEKAGWTVLWRLPHEPAVPADAEFVGDFKAAAAAVIRTLAENGLLIRSQFYDGNRTLVISGAGPVSSDPQ